jgi:general secretion pathway protein K
MIDKKAQSGIALLTVLLVLAIASIVLVSMSTRGQLDIRRTSNLLKTAQAFEYVYSLENWARDVLYRDASTNTFDSLQDNWTIPLPETVVQGGTVQASIGDLQGRFNLNNLLVNGEASTLDVDRFRRLLVLLDINPATTDAILDWMDTDNTIRYPNGAEDETYMDKATPYRSANRPFSDVSELLLVDGIRRADYQRLQPYIYVAEGYAPLNINTAAPVLLSSLANKIPEKDMDSIINAIKHEPFTSVGDFIRHKAVAKLGMGNAGLSVRSQHFFLTTNIQAGKLLLQFTTQLSRAADGAVTVVKRQRRSPANG